MGSNRFLWWCDTKIQNVIRHDNNNVIRQGTCIFWYYTQVLKKSWHASTHLFGCTGKNEKARLACSSCPAHFRESWLDIYSSHPKFIWDMARSLEISRFISIPFWSNPDPKIRRNHDHWRRRAPKKHQAVMTPFTRVTWCSGQCPTIDYSRK